MTTSSLKRSRRTPSSSCIVNGGRSGPTTGPTSGYAGSRCGRRSARQPAPYDVDARRALCTPWTPSRRPSCPDPELRAALLALPPMQRAVVVLFYLEDRPMEEVADLLDCRPSTGFVHLHRARRRLADLLSEPFSEEVDGDVR